MTLQDAIMELNETIVTVKTTAENVITAYDEEGNEVSYNTEEAQALVESKAYIDSRESAYPSIGEQLDMQYWDAVNGTTTWKDAIAQVKADNPKPE